MNRAAQDLFSSIKRVDSGNSLYFNEELSDLCYGLDSALVLNTTKDWISFSFIKNPSVTFNMTVLYSIFKSVSQHSFKFDTSLIKPKRPTSFTFLKFASREVFLEIIKEKFPAHFEMFLWHPELLDLE